MNLLLAPAPLQWQGRGSDAPEQSLEAWAAFPGDPPSPWALPARLVVIERFTLPSTDREELDAMLRLQLEKTLPYPIEETTFAWQLLSSRPLETAPQEEEAPPAQPLMESTLLVWAVHLPALETLFAPLLSRELYPSRVTLWGSCLAATLPREKGASCAFWEEEGQLVFAIMEEGTLLFNEIAASTEVPYADFPQWLLSAELAGASTQFTTAWIAPGLERMAQELATLADAPPRPLPIPERLPDATPDLTPPVWIALRQRRGQRQRLMRRLLQILGLYLVFIAGAFIWSGVKNHRLRKLEAEAQAAQPQAETLLAQQLRWRALAPAVEPQRFTVEILLQITNSLPSPEVRITQFEQTPAGFMITGEAPNGTLAVDFLEALKQNPALREYTLSADAPTFLPNEKAQFRIFGK